MAQKLRTKREYSGRYTSLNATPAVTIERDSEGWSVQWGDHTEQWRSLADCRAVVESVAAMPTGEHAFPLVLR